MFVHLAHRSLSQHLLRSSEKVCTAKPLIHFSSPPLLFSAEEEEGKGWRLDALRRKENNKSNINPIFLARVRSLMLDRSPYGYIEMIEARETGNGENSTVPRDCAETRGGKR